MMDISKQSVSANCPECKRVIKVTLKQVVDEVIITCICGQKIQLEDRNGSNRNAIQKINKSFQDLENTLKKFGR